MPSAADPFDRVEINSLEVNCIIGVYPSERTTPQPLVVDAALGIDTRAAASAEDLSATIDYGRFAGELRFMLERCRFGLIETAAEVLARYALLPPLAQRPTVFHVALRIQKPRALVGGAVPAVLITRARTDHAAPAVAAGTTPSVETIFTGRDCVVERHTWRAGSDQVVSHDSGDAHELTLTAGLTLNGQAVAACTAHTLEGGCQRRYVTSTHDVSTLVVRRPDAVWRHIAPNAVLSKLARGMRYDAPGALSTSERP